MKKSYIIILVILLALIITCFWVLKISHKSTESMPNEDKIEFVEQEKVQPAETGEETEVSEESVVENAEVKVTVQPRKAAVKKTEEVTEVQKPAEEVKEAATATTTNTNVKKKKNKKPVKKTSVSEENELLEKTPPAKEVIVDKEIKVRKTGKYIFK